MVFYPAQAFNVDMDGDGPAIQDAKQLDHEKACHDAGIDLALEDECESDGDFVLADSDDDVKDFAIVDAKVEKVKNFLFRPAFQKLHNLGLASLPRHVSGCSISYHSKERRWQGIYPGKTKGMSSSWGGHTHRTEEEALIKVIRVVLTAYRKHGPRTSYGKHSLKRWSKPNPLTSTSDVEFAIPINSPNLYLNVWASH